MTPAAAAAPFPASHAQLPYTIQAVILRKDARRKTKNNFSFYISVGEHRKEFVVVKIIFHFIYQWGYTGSNF